MLYDRQTTFPKVEIEVNLVLYERNINYLLLDWIIKYFYA